MIHSFFPQILRLGAILSLILGILAVIFIFCLISIYDFSGPAFPESFIINLFVVSAPVFLTVGLIFAIWSYIWNLISRQKKN